MEDSTKKEKITYSSASQQQHAHTPAVSPRHYQNSVSGNIRTS
jgi:hypothetical protein